ncbi:MAG: RNA-binding protein [Alphaproteobacteria bacterium]|nr:RNA-binding protein [Pseudomonadota bacterium]
MIALVARESPGVPARREPRRRCIVTGEVLPKEAMIRFVLGPDGRVVPDIRGDLPGRGLWLGARRERVETALTKGRFAQALRRPVEAPADLAEEVERRLSERCLDLLGLARRARLALAGFEKVERALKGGDVRVLIAARDGAPGGCAKLRAKARDMTLVDLFSAAELGRVFGRERVVHAALRAGGLTKRALLEIERLRAYRSHASSETN